MFKSMKKTMFFKLVLTNLILTAVYSLNYTIDCAIAGNLLSPDALTALGICRTIRLAPDALVMLFSTGGAIMFARAIGRFNDREAAVTFSNAFYAAIVSGIILLVICIFITTPYLDMFQTSVEIRRNSETFMRWWYPCAICDMSTFPLAFMNADGAIAYTLASGVLFFIIKIAATLLLLPYIGIGALPIATALADLPTIVIVLLRINSKKSKLRLLFNFDARLFWESIVLSSPTISMYLSFIVLSFVQAKISTAMFQQRGIAIMNVGLAIFGICDIFSSIADSGLPLLSMSGATEDSRSVRRVANWMYGTLLAIGGAVTLAFVLFPDQTTGWIGLNGAEPGEIRTAVRLCAIACIPAAAARIWIQHAQALGLIAMANIGSFIRISIAPLICGIICCYCFGPMGVTGFTLGIGVAFPVCLLISILGNGPSRWFYMIDRSKEHLTRNYELELTPREISTLVRKIRSDFGALLPEDGRRMMHVALMVDETLNKIIDFNEGCGRRIRGEVFVDARNDEHTSIAICDDGKIFNITDPDLALGNFRDFIIGCLMTDTPDRANIISCGCNRNLFRIS